MRKSQSNRMRVAFGAGIALALSACDASNETPLLPPSFSNAAGGVVSTSEPESGAGTTAASDTTPTQRGAYVGAGY
jgi:hypothetical protein